MACIIQQLLFRVFCSGVEFSTSARGKALCCCLGHLPHCEKQKVVFFFALGSSTI